LSQFCNPGADGFVLTGDLLVSLERRQGALGISKVQIRDDAEVAVGGGIVRIGRNGLLVRVRSLLELSAHALRRPELGPGDGTGAVALHG